eukprot:1159232-Pelagomonas_calceolata.AAC.16
MTGTRALLKDQECTSQANFCFNANMLSGSATCVSSEVHHSCTGPEMRGLFSVPGWLNCARTSFKRKRMPQGFQQFFPFPETLLSFLLNNWSRVA